MCFYCEWFLPILLQAFIVKIPATVVVCVATSLVNEDEYNENNYRSYNVLTDCSTLTSASTFVSFHPLHLHHFITCTRAIRFWGEKNDMIEYFVSVIKSKYRKEHFNARRYSSAVYAMDYVSMSVCLSVRHKAEFYQSGWTDRAGVFLNESLFLPILHRLIRKF